MTDALNGNRREARASRRQGKAHALAQDAAAALIKGKRVKVACRPEHQDFWWIRIKEALHGRR